MYSIKCVKIIYSLRDIYTISLNRGQSWRRGTKYACATGCGFDPHSRKLNIYVNLYFRFFALVWSRSVRWKFGGKWATECLNTNLPRPALLCTGYGVKLISLYSQINIWWCTIKLVYHSGFNAKFHFFIETEFLSYKKYIIIIIFLTYFRTNGFYIWFPSILNSLVNHDGAESRICDVLEAEQKMSNGTEVIILLCF